MGQSKVQRGVRFLLLGVIVAVAGCDGQCGDCNPSFQECSLAPTAGNPPAAAPPSTPFTMECTTAVSPGNNITLSALLNGGLPPWRYSVTWGDGMTDEGRASAPGTVRVSHTYARAERHDVRIAFTATDEANSTQTCAATFTVTTAPPSEAP